MAYTMPPNRSFTGGGTHATSLEDTNNYPAPNSILDISGMFNTATPAGSKGRICVSSDGLHLAEANDTTTNIRLVGVNFAPVPAFGPIPVGSVPDIIKKLRGLGINFVRIWGPELHLMTGGVGTTTSAVRGTNNFAATRWDELDFLTSELKKAGIYYGFVPAAYNLGMDVGAAGDRYSTTVNVSGSIPTVTVSGGGVVTAVSTPTGATGYFSAPTVYQNNSVGTITFGGVTAGVQTVTGSAGATFAAGDVGKTITLFATSIQAVITAFGSSTSVTVDLKTTITPSAYVNTAGNADLWSIGSPGTGARYRAIIDGPSGVDGFTGTVQSIVVENGGTGYDSATPPKLFFTGTNKICHHRILPDITVQESWKELISLLLNHVNAYTGIAYKNESALALMECFNESGMYFTIAANASKIPTMWRDHFYSWLKTKYGTIAALKTRYGAALTSANYAEFSDIQWRKADFVPTTISNGWEYADSMEWLQDESLEYYRWMRAYIAAQGYSGITVGSDISDSPQTLSQTQDETVQSSHVYTGTGTLYTAASVTRDNNRSFTSPIGPANIATLYSTMAANKPLLLTECGIGHPVKSRGLVAMFPGLAAKKGYSLVCFHSDWLDTTTFGGAGNLSRSKGLYSNNFCGDPVQRAGQFLGAVLFHRGDVSESPVSQTITVNKKALGFTTPTGGTVGPMVACPANGALPDYTTTTYFVKSYHAHTRLAGHVRFAWDATNLGDYAAASPNIPKDYASFKNQTLSQNYGSPTASVSPFIGGIGLAADDDSYDWAITKLNGIGSGWLYGAEGLNLVYTKKDANYPDNTVFVDMAAGVSGVNSPRTQFGGISFSESREDGYQKRSPNGTWVTDKTHNTVAVRDGVFNLNAIGNRFWKNLRIVNITDYSLLGITSANSSTIALSNSIIIVFAANHHNTGVDYSSNGNIMSGVATNAAGTGYTLESPEVIAADGTSPYGTGALPLAMINTATGFVTGYRMSLGGSSYSGSPTVSLHTKNGGSGASTGAVSVLPAPETQEAKLATSWTGAHEGWPILAQLAFADFVIDGIDGTKNWSLWELDFTGARVQQIPLTMKTATQVQILLSTGQTVKPTIFYELSC